MPHFKAFDMMNLQYEIRIWYKLLNKATNDQTKTSQDNDLNYTTVNFRFKEVFGNSKNLP
jgi:hypothetical protein